VWAAKTRGEIAPIFRDLPSPYAAVATPAPPAGDPRYWNAGLRPFRRGVPAPLLVVLAVLIVLSAIAHFPFFLLGFAVFWFVVLRHRGPRRAGPHPRRVGPAAEQQPERGHHHGLTGAGLAGQRGEPGRELEHRVVDDAEAGDPDFLKHARLRPPRYGRASPPRAGRTWPPAGP